MSKKLTIAAAAVSATLALGGCSASRGEAAPELSRTSGRVIGGELPGRAVEALPHATVYRMAGDATAANVPVEVDSRGNITSYPAPADVAGCEPIALGNGWLLDRRGISTNSVFTRYTYKEYSALQSAPGLQQLKAAIISGSRATDIHRLDMTPSEAAADTAAVKAIINNF